MKYDPDKHHRRSIRLKGYDYTQEGAYFVTLVSERRVHLFGRVVNGEMRLNDFGRIVAEEWERTAELRPNIVCGPSVVMPNHFHGIVVIEGQATTDGQPTIEQFGKPIAGSLPTLVRSFKSAVTKRINDLRKTPGAPVWQRNYYERVIRDEAAYHRIAEYIAKNPQRWDEG
jgi:putative transposase